MKKILLPLALLAGFSATAQTAKPTGEVAEHLHKFDDLDFNVFSNEEWSRFKESHAENIVVHWPDGHTTTGLPRHIQDMKDLFAFAPDTKIKEHPIKFGEGNYTAVTGFMTGTFTKPMKMPNGQVIQPTGKHYNLPMVTIGVWQNGLMTQEYLWWDNQLFMKQLGVTK